MSWQNRFKGRDEFHAEVRRLVLQCGLSYGRAAEVIGYGTTKNQVVRAMQTILGRSRSTVRFPDSIWPSVPKRSEDEPSESPPEIPVHLTRVREGQCRAPLWPDFLRSATKVSPADHMLCGVQCKEGSSFCVEHHALYFAVPPPRSPSKRKEFVDKRMSYP